MSTKMTLAYNSAEDETDFHLYLECFEPEAVYLSLGKAQFMRSYDGALTVRIPQEVFKQIANKAHFKQLEKHNASGFFKENE